ncbi:MAG: DegT/DnrJ/EryC1/StrS family aminotransferase [Telmatospirillum sp.]|nr:DegT/DnrJ/EryC1/StrS family aminotransferase [Telmatospirillum sp.]
MRDALPPPAAPAEVPIIALSDPDITAAECDSVTQALASPALSAGPGVGAFEDAFAASLGRRHAIAVTSGSAALWLLLRAMGIGAGDEVVAAPFSFRGCVDAVRLAGARPVFADVDYWSGTLAPEKAAARISAATRAILAVNVNGHPADWTGLRALAARHGLPLIEDSSEAIGSRHRGALVGTFGDASIFDFSQPSPVISGEGGMVVTDDDALARTIRQLRGGGSGRARRSGGPALGIAMSDLAAALACAQLRRLPEILEKRRRVELFYRAKVRSFEGIKDPYVAPDATEVHWFLYVVHLGTRFSRASRDAIIDDLAVAGIEAAPYCRPLSPGPSGAPPDSVRECPVMAKVADRALALPFHTHLDADRVAFIVETMKDSSVNVGAGAAIYL